MVFSEKVFIALSFAFGNEHNDQVNIKVYKDESLKDMHFTKRDFPVFAQEGTEAAKYIRARPPECHAGSEENFQRMRGWMQTCKDKHPRCKIRSGGEPLPTRLIRLSESSGRSLQLKLVLVEDCERPIEYAALSYCWGGKQALTLSKANVESLSQAISVDTLAPTLHDAVRVCRRLEIQYMWVDALCIIQDDDTSKMCEIPKMGSIYKGALVTISASSASNTEAGFLKEREPPFDPREVVRLPFWDELGEKSECFITFSRDRHFGEPLEDRGWTLQENLLSTRILVFKTRHLQWKCQELDTIDGYRHGTFPFFSVAMPPAPPPRDSPQWPDWKRRALYTYEQIVRDYTKRKLTLEDDRPLAISGIATEFGRMLGDQYIAGHWVSTLPLNLLWYKSDRYMFGHSGNYEGPTWSWPSAGIAIGIEPILARTEGHLSDCTVMAKVVEVRPKLLVNDAPYGAFGQGTSLVLEGRMLQNVFLPRMYDPEPVTMEKAGLRCFVHGAVKFDEFEEEFHREGLKGHCPILLELCTMSGPDCWKEIQGLVLDPVAGKHSTFTRSTMFRIMFEIYDLPDDDESERVSSTWLKEELDRRNPFNGAPVVKLELL